MLKKLYFFTFAFLILLSFLSPCIVSLSFILTLNLSPCWRCVRFFQLQLQVDHFNLTKSGPFNRIFNSFLLSFNFFANFIQTCFTIHFEPLNSVAIICFSFQSYIMILMIISSFFSPNYLKFESLWIPLNLQNICFTNYDTYGWVCVSSY